MRLYVINLARSADRRAHIERVFDRMGLKFIRIEAVDGHTLDNEEYERMARECHRGFALDRGFGLTRGEVGCFLSHRKFLKLAAESADPYSTVFEDDIRLSPRTEALLRDWQWIPTDSDIVKLDRCEMSCLVKPSSQEIAGSYRLGKLMSTYYGTGGYVISRQAAIRLYDLTKRIFAPIDIVYYDRNYGILSTFNVQQMIPAPVCQDSSLDSTIRAKPLKEKLSAFQKIRREVRRLTSRKFQKKFWSHCLFLWFRLTRNYHWGKIDFQ